MRCSRSAWLGVGPHPSASAAAATLVHVPALRRQPLQVHAFLRLDAAEAQPKLMRVTFNTASLMRRRNLQDQQQEEQGGISSSKGEGMPQQLAAALGQLPKPVSVSSATVKARRKVERVVLQNLRQQQKLAPSGPARTVTSPQGPPSSSVPSAQPPPTSSPDPDVIMELVLEGNAVADFAGVLTLLLECGQHEEQVIAAGSMFLNARNGASAKTRAMQPGMQDVVLCVALAHAQLAFKAMGSETVPLILPGAPRPQQQPLSTAVKTQDSHTRQAPSAAVLEVAYGHVSEALRVLREHSAAVGNLAQESATLREQLLDMLLQVAPLHAGHLLNALPSDNGASSSPPKQQRSRAVDVLKSSLWQLEGAAQRAELLGQVRPWLSAAEQITLYDDAPVPETQLSEQELYDTALACIWQGYTQRWPHHVYRADALLHIIAHRKDLGVDVTLERNVCALLLGKQSEAQGQLVAAHAAATAGLVTGVTRDKGEVAKAGGVGAKKGQGEGGAAAGKQAGDGKGGGKLAGLLPSSPWKNKAGEAGGKAAAGAGEARGGKRSGGHERLQLGAEDSAFVVMESSDNLQEEVSALEDWAERWLELAVMPLFSMQPTPQNPSPGTAGTAAAGAAPEAQGVSVRSYLSSPKVAVFNQVLRYANEQNLRHVTENLQHLSHDSLQQLLSLWRSGTTSLAQSVMRTSPRDPPQQQQQQQEGAAQPAAGKAKAKGQDWGGPSPSASGVMATAAAAVPVVEAGVPQAAPGMPGMGAQGRTAPLASQQPSVGLAAAAHPSSLAATAAVTLSGEGSVTGVSAEAGLAVARESPSAAGATGSIDESMFPGDGVGARGSDGEDVVGLEALPWVQIYGEESAPNSATAGTVDAPVAAPGRTGRSSRLARQDGSSAAAADPGWSSDEGEEVAPVAGLGGTAPLWVLGPQGVIRPRISARIVDPTHGRLPGPAALQVQGGGMRGMFARAVGITAVVVAIAAGGVAVAIGARHTRAGVVAPASGAREAVVVPARATEAQTKSRGGWRFWRRGAAQPPVQGVAATLQQQQQQQQAKAPAQGVGR